MSLFTNLIRYQSPKIQAFWFAHRHHGRRCIASYAAPMDLSSPTGFFIPIADSPSIKNELISMTKDTSLASIRETMVDSLQSLLGDISTWFIKRTYQPSIIRKRRKHGFMRRKESVGGRRVLKRRIAKGRMRLGGC
mmetsp:Transcript_22048/g.53371  ORF Transcript_22048/g.53371 Transcript_22048/m.53371 type:complete len:136 (-) Transcript_22048:122-529(-)